MYIHLLLQNRALDKKIAVAKDSLSVDAVENEKRVKNACKNYKEWTACILIISIN